MQLQSELEYRQRRAYELVTVIESLNASITRMLDQKVAFEEELRMHLGHEHDGQKSYDLWDKRVVVKTPLYYKVDKHLYTSNMLELPYEYNPVLTKISYDVDKNKYKQLMQNAPENIKTLLEQLITTNTGKLAINIESRNR